MIPYFLVENIDLRIYETNQRIFVTVGTPFGLAIPKSDVLDIEHLFEKTIFLDEKENWHEKFVPQIISPRQFRLALIHSGKSIAQIEAFIKDLENESVWITWEYSIQFERNDAMLNEFAEALEITQEQLDQLFILGATL